MVYQNINSSTGAARRPFSPAKARQMAIRILLCGLVALAGCADMNAPPLTNNITAAPPPAPREFRAAWVATVANIDWPSKKASPSSSKNRKSCASSTARKRTQPQRDHLPGPSRRRRALRLRVRAVVRIPVRRARKAAGALLRPAGVAGSSRRTSVGSSCTPGSIPTAHATPRRKVRWRARISRSRIRPS